MTEMKDGCVKPARGPILPTADPGDLPSVVGPTKEMGMTRVQVGKEAIDFEANAFIEGVGFNPVKLSDYKGKWIVLCFYPGDFTFV
jgi:peroxiredoxin (alkyl hydroperoxide reductase subunit C)